jgi:hypothetical protein
MAAANLTSGERMDVYLRMFLLNRSFHLIVLRLHKLKPLLNAQDLKDIIGLTQETQLEINTALLNTLETLESSDHAHFGKVRIALEKRLKTPR